MATDNTSSAFLVKVFESAKAQGGATLACVALLKSGHIKWDDKESVIPVAREFRLGRMCGSLKITRAEADRVDELVRHKPGSNSLERRTADQEKAYHAAVSAFTHCAYLAGKPKKTGEKRAEKARKPANPVTQQPGATNAATAILSTPKAESTSDVLAFALKVADTLRAYESRNAGVKLGDLSGVFAAFIEGVKAAAKGAPKAKTPKAPRAPKAPKALAPQAIRTSDGVFSIPVPSAATRTDTAI